MSTTSLGYGVGVTYFMAGTCTHFKGSLFSRFPDNNAVIRGRDTWWRERAHTLKETFFRAFFSQSLKSATTLGSGVGIPYFVAGRCKYTQRDSFLCFFFQILNSTTTLGYGVGIPYFVAGLCMFVACYACCCCKSQFTEEAPTVGIPTMLAAASQGVCTYIFVYIYMYTYIGIHVYT